MPTGANSARFTINGPLDTNNFALENMERLTTACGSWLTYDARSGQWAVVINRAGIAVMSFDDSNILSTIEVSGTGLTDLYNSVKVTFPHRDLRDQADFVTVAIPDADRNNNEPDNALDINFEVVNDPVQAELLGFQELKQSRVDRVISFETDYSALRLKAGDLIDVTNSVFNYTNKMFRVTNIAETEDEQGAIRMRINALEYALDVYNPDDLFEYARTNTNGIITIGSIGTPTSPTITRFQTDARPRIVLQATTPIGIVEGMEFWVSQTSSSTGFELLGTTYPIGGGSYGSGQTATLDVDYLNSGNVWSKVRGVNSTTAGPFSAVASQTYTPKQVTQATNTSTEVLDSGGNNILSTLSLSALLALLNGLLANNQTGSGSMWDQIFNLFASTTGSDIRTGQVPGVGVPLGNAFARVTVAGQANVNAVGADYFELVAGNNITITTNASTDQITINATGGGGSGNIGNLLVGPGGNTAIPLTANVQFVGNVATVENHSDVLIAISGNLAANPDQVRFSAKAANATHLFNSQGTAVFSGGPFTVPLTSIGPAVLTVTSEPLMVQAVASWLYSGNGIVDTDKKFTMNVFINGTQVESVGDSSRFGDAYTNQVTAVRIANVTAGGNVAVDFTVESDVATGCRVDYLVTQPMVSVIV